MKPILIKVGAFADNQITIIERCDPHFNTPFHFHPECELVYVTESSGKRIVGDSIESFDVGDMVFLGPTYRMFGITMKDITRLPKT